MNTLIARIALDGRYTQVLEYVGAASPLHVARFNRVFISAHPTKQEALQACVDAYKDRMMDYN